MYRLKNNNKNAFFSVLYDVIFMLIKHQLTYVFLSTLVLYYIWLRHLRKSAITRSLCWHYL